MHRDPGAFGAAPLRSLALCVLQVPKLAQEAHSAAIDRTVDEALRRSGVGAEELSAVAVTVGPGLSLCLGVGVQKAVRLAQCYQLLLCRVHHMEAHAMVTWLPSSPPPRLDLKAATDAPPTDAAAGAPIAEPAEGGAAAPAAPSSSSSAAAKVATVAPSSAEPPAPAAAAAEPTASTALSPDGVPPFPFLTLLVSGGHNMLVLSVGLGRHTILGSTLDDSIGERLEPPTPTPPTPTSVP